MLGRARDEIKEGYRSFSEGNHVIFYRMAGSAIEVRYSASEHGH
ncbi:MAG: hypothetical protein P0107_07520 [Nitrosomonas sp.]|nr:hypothetical protein [Nitrosomonas sp.]